MQLKNLKYHSLKINEWLKLTDVFIYTNIQKIISL